MSQYLQFRSWLRTGSPAEKKLAAASVVVVLGLLGWALVPTGGPGGGSVAVGGGGPAAGPGSGPSAGGATGPAGAGGGPGTAGGASRSPSAAGTASASGAASASGTASAASGTGAGTVAGSGAGAGGGASGPAGAGTAPGTGTSPGPATGPSSSSPACGRLGASDTGVTATQIKVADILLNLGGAIGNQAVGQSSPQTQQQMAQAVVDDINSHGGVACRKLVVTYYQANPIDPTSTQNVCLQIQQGGFFAVIGGFAYPESANDCLAQQKIPVVANIAPTPSEARQYYPYLMSPSAGQASDFLNAILGMKSRGWFTAGQGFKKLAILEDDCSQEINQDVYSYLIQAGVPASQIVKNEFSCPSGGFASPSDMSNFATQDNLSHITNVVVVTGGGSFKEFTNAAQGQGYKPKYLVSDYDGFMVTATSSTGPDPNNFDGTVATSDTRFGETSTPGLSDPGTQACVALFNRHGLPASYVTGSYFGASNCNLFELFAAAASKDVGPTRAGLVNGLGQLGHVAEAYPTADAVFKAPGTVTPVKVWGGDFWWTIQFYASCTCWKVIDRTERPSFG